VLKDGRNDGEGRTKGHERMEERMRKDGNKEECERKNVKGRM
jgi:hypothetical protein